eukprot:m.731430 g.731430  ORF g.731430 m.731430 type:complete len:685 (-) comp23058_c1_seq3:208-2262(-)
MSSFSDLSYFVKGVGLREAEKVLKQGCVRIGTFVVRESTSRKGQLSLSLKVNNTEKGVAHYQICTKGERLYLPDNPREEYRSIPDLIAKWAHLCKFDGGHWFHLGERHERQMSSGSKGGHDDLLATDMSVPSYIERKSELYVSAKAARQALTIDLQMREKMEHPLGVSIALVKYIRAELRRKFPDTYMTMTTTDVSSALILPLTANIAGGSKQKSYVNYIKENSTMFQNSVCTAPLQPATIFVSHAWQYGFMAASEVMINYATEQSTPQYFWLDLFSNSQHDTSQRPYEWWETVFKTTIGKIGSVLLIMMPWNNPAPLKRAWCLFEIFCSIEENTKLALRLPEGQQDELVSSLSTGDSIVLQHLGEIDAERAESSNEHDRQMIFKLIRDNIGFDGINDKVKEHIRNWIIETAEFHASKVDLGLELLTAVAKLFQRLGKIELSRSLYERRLQQARLRFCEGHPMIGQAWANLGAIYYEMKEYSKAVDSSKRALRIFEGSGMTGDSMAEREKDVAMTYMNLGHALKRNGKPERAKDCYERAECIARKLCEGGRTSKEVRKILANTVSAVGVMLRHVGQSGAAIPKHREALGIKKGIDGMNELSTAVILYNLALAYKDVDNYDEAVDAFKHALDIRRTILGQDNPETLKTKQMLEETRELLEELQYEAGILPQPQQRRTRKYFSKKR